MSHLIGECLSTYIMNGELVIQNVYDCFTRLIFVVKFDVG